MTDVRLLVHNNKVIDCPGCGGHVSVIDGTIEDHNQGDWPDWIDDRACSRSGKKLIRRTPKRRWRKSRRPQR